MPKGFVVAAVLAFILVTLVWAAVWWWLPALFRGRGGGGREESRLRDSPSNLGARGSRAHDGPHRGRGPRGYSGSDQRIVEEVSDGLTRAGAVDASDVFVETHAGEVALHGTVASERQRQIAGEIAGSVRGVDGVRNQLRVEPAEGNAPHR